MIAPNLCKQIAETPRLDIVWRGGFLVWLSWASIWKCGIFWWALSGPEKQPLSNSSAREVEHYRICFLFVPVVLNLGWLLRFGFQFGACNSHFKKRNHSDRILYWPLTLMKNSQEKKVLILNIAADFRYLIFLSQ